MERNNNAAKTPLTVEIIPSKSFAHRALICATLAGHPEAVTCDFPSKDIEATKACMKAIHEGTPELACGESGSTLRFLLPVMGALGRKGIFLAEGRLPERPLSPLYEELVRQGCTLSEPGANPITIEGQLKPGDYVIPGNVSSQFISGLLMALPVLQAPCRVIVPGKLESSAYVDITLDVMKQFGVTWTQEETSEGRQYIIDGTQAYHCPENYQVEGDWSGAAFWVCAGALGDAPITITGLNQKSIQGDRAMADIARQFGARTEETEDTLTIYPSKLTGTTIDVSEVPDLAPAIALLAAAAEGESQIVGAGRLRIKESDRLATIAETLRNLGGDVTEEETSMTIRGTAPAGQSAPASPTSTSPDRKPLAGGWVDGYNDHRIVMMAAIASLISTEPVKIRGKQAVAKSYPTFFDELARMNLGGNLE